MNAARPYQLMALNNAWANATFYTAAAALDDAQHLAKAPGFFPTLSATLNHIYEVDLFYVDALEAGGLGRSVYDREDVAGLSDLAALQADTDARLARFCHALTVPELEEMRDTDRKDGPVQETVSALLLHLFQHQIHHRGQAHVQLQSLGVPPPQLDDFYLNYGRVPSAAAYWP